MDDTRKQIYNELFLAPSVVLPVVSGSTAWLLSWGLGGITLLNGVGLVAVLFGVGWFATRFIFQLESITEKAFRDQITKKIKEEDAKLDDLMLRLRADKDYRTKDYLMLLRTNRAELERISQSPGVQLRSMEIVKQGRQLFWASIEQLEQSLRLYNLAERLNGDDRNEVLKEREHFVNEAKESSEHLQVAVRTFRQFVDKNQDMDLDTLQAELRESIEVAKRTEERMRDLEGKPDYESYLRQ